MASYQQRVVLILTAVFGFASACIMISRLVIERSRAGGLCISSYLTIVAVLCVLFRAGPVPPVVL
jgi:hypothetical protein